jgi:hypothetical protein
MVLVAWLIFALAFLFAPGYAKLAITGESL